jgi:AAA+ superfamily predicted ATPase
VHYFFAVLIFLSGSQFLRAELPNFESSTSISPWLDTVDSPQYLEYSSRFEYGATIALGQVLDKGDWQIVAVANYRCCGEPDGFPPTWLNVQEGQNPVVNKRRLGEGYYYLQKKDSPAEHLVINISAPFYNNDWGRNLVVYYKANFENQVIALKFMDDLKAMDGSQSVYQGGVLELKENGSLGFLGGISKYKNTWEDFIYEEKQKRNLQEGIDGFLTGYDEAKWDKFGLPMSRGFLLYGPPGTGKSFLGKVLISNVKNKIYKRPDGTVIPVSMLLISARHIQDPTIIHDIYNIARKLTPCIVFIEDVDLIAGTDRANNEGIKNEFLQALNGIEPLRGVLTIATTNEGDKIDSALKRSQRLGYHFEIGLPTHQERLALINLFVKSYELAADVDLISLADNSESWTGADWKELFQIAAETAVRDSSFGSEGKVLLKNKHIQSALEYRQLTRFKNSKEAQ